MVKKVSDQVYSLINLVKGVIKEDSVKPEYGSQMFGISYICPILVYYRIMKAYGVKTIDALSDCLGITSGRVYVILRENLLVPEIHVLKCFMDTGANPFWLLTGNCEMYRHDLSEYIEN